MKSVFRERWLGWNHSLEKTRVKFITSIISFFVVMGLLSPFFISSIKLQSQRNAIETVVSQANLNDRDPISVALLERGEVTTSLGVFKSTQLRSMGDELFDRNGKIIDGTVISDVLLAPASKQMHAYGRKRLSQIAKKVEIKSIKKTITGADGRSTMNIGAQVGKFGARSTSEITVPSIIFPLRSNSSSPIERS